MTNTFHSFRDKWDKNPHAFFDETLREDSETFKWILNRNGFADSKALTSFLNKKVRILDAGCGNGRVTALLRKHSDPAATEIVGIDVSSAHIAAKNLSDYSNVKVYQKDLLSDLSDLGAFDFIYCQEVLHHTKNPKKAFFNLCGQLDQNGEIAIYVYKKKAPIREFADDFIRNKISGLEYDKAMEICKQITELGRMLSNTNIKITVPSVDVLAIKAGEYDLQRFVYHFFMKCFWNSSVSYQENVIVNYDWYHPQDCSRHTLEEIRGWFKEANLSVIHEFEDFYGITMRGKTLNKHLDEQ